MQPYQKNQEEEDPDIKKIKKARFDRCNLCNLIKFSAIFVTLFNMLFNSNFYFRKQMNWKWTEKKVAPQNPCDDTLVTVKENH